jgi:hypothetical protein
LYLKAVVHDLLGQPLYIVILCSLTTFLHRVKKKIFGTGLQSFENAPNSGRLESVISKDNVAKVKEIIEKDARFTVCHIR